MRANFESAIAILHRAVALSTARAAETLTAALGQVGLDPVELPKGGLTYVVRLCDSCSRETRTPVAERATNVLPAFIGVGSDGGRR